jgi:hypothetical protein
MGSKLFVKSGLLFVLLLPLQGCGVYSFTGANIDPEIKTVSIANFFNEATLGPPDLSQRFTESLKEFFQNNTNLRLVPSNGDLQLEGSISSYEVTPAAPTADNRAALNQLVVRVKVKYVNTFNEKDNFETVFASPPATFPQTESLQVAEQNLLPDILKQLNIDIFNKTVTNW